jgi:hypothetical protein
LYSIALEQQVFPRPILIRSSLSSFVCVLSKIKIEKKSNDGGGGGGGDVRSLSEKIRIKSKDIQQ